MLIRCTLECFHLAYAVAWGLGVLLLLGAAPAHQESDPNSHTNAQDTGSKQKLPVPPIFEPSYSGLIDQSACKPSQDSHDKEFCIAWRATMAAEDQAFWAKIACLVGVGGIGFVVRTLHYTRKATEAAQASAQAAERSVAENARTLAHAQDVAARDLRPWLTLSARLTEGVDFDRFDTTHQRFEAFVEIRLMNVGKVAAKNITYSIAGIDGCLDIGDRHCLDAMVDKTTENCKLIEMAESLPPKAWERSCDVLAPSETHECRLYCVIPGPEPGSVWEETPRTVFRLRIALAVGYSSAGTSDTVFFTAKVFPIGKNNLIQFLDVVSRDEMPLAPKDVVLGTAEYAKIS